MLLGTKRARDLFVSELERVRTEFRFKLAGYVVMPNHVHLLISEPARSTISTALKKLKQRVSRKMRKRRGPSEVGEASEGLAVERLVGIPEGREGVD
jgi:REP element-mobilizing transposase RayT